MVGRIIMVLFKMVNGRGKHFLAWYPGTITRHYTKPRTKQSFNFEVEFEDDERRDIVLSTSRYVLSTDVDEHTSEGAWTALDRKFNIC